MPPKQQTVAAMDGHSADAPTPLLQRIRNMWEFANLCQWIYIFGKAAKIDEALEIEDIETECLKPASTVLSDVALALLKLVSSHRGITHQILDEQLRKEYISRMPNDNPFGDGEAVSRSFSDFDTLTKIIVLQQITQWVMSQPERLRNKMDESKDIDQTSWRIEPYGWDADDRTYYVLDDNRVYRLSENPDQPARKQKKQKTYGIGQRSSRRRNTSGKSLTENHAPTECLAPEAQQLKSNLGNMSWECVAVTLYDVRDLVDSFRKTRDANEKILRHQLDEHLLPILEKQEESRKRKDAQRQRELLSLAKMANAKRSSRIAGKAEQQKEEEKAKEEREKAQKELEGQRREKQKQMKLERERDFRMFEREKRLKERAARRRLHEEELTQLSEGKSTPDGRMRISDRHLRSEIDRNRLALKELEEEEEDWTFDCVCGLYGQVDDGAHSIACERCNVWQHSNCVGIQESEADRADFHFVCGSCKRQAENGNTPRKTVIKWKAKTSEESLRHHPDSIEPQANPRPPALGTSMNTTEVSSGTLGKQPGIEQSSALTNSPGIDAKVHSNGDDAKKLVSESTPTVAISAGKGLGKQTRTTESTIDQLDNGAQLAAGYTLPLATTSIPQAEPSAGTTFSSQELKSTIGSSDLLVNAAISPFVHRKTPMR